MRHRAAELAGRALRLRCPHCGGGPVFTRWLLMLPNCPSCGFRFERGERGYWLGAYFVNLMIVETTFVAWVGAWLLLTWPDPPWTLLWASTIALMGAVPFLAFPWSRTLFLAFDLIIRPANSEDFALPHERAGARL